MPPLEADATMKEPSVMFRQEKLNDQTKSQGLRHRTWLEVKEQLHMSLPTMASQLLYQLPWLISLHFVGAIGEQELAAGALSSTLCNVTGISLSVGLSSALTTLTSQARGNMLRQQGLLREISSLGYGETESLVNGSKTSDYNSSSKDTQKHEQVDSGRPLLPLIFLYRGIAIQLLFVVPVGLWWIWGIEPALAALGQQPELASMTAQYMRILAPGLWSYSINWTLTAWLQAMGMADVPAFAAGVGLTLHIPFNLLYVYGLKQGYLGCAMATVSFQLVQPFLIIAYLFRTSHGTQRVLLSASASTICRTKLSFWKEARLALKSLRGICRYLSLAVPGIVLVSEWWASEVSVFLSGRLQPRPALALDGMTLYQSINSFVFMFPMSCSVAGAARVGSLLGQGDSEGAAFASKVAVLCSFIVSGAIGCFLFLSPHTLLPSFFTKEAEVIHEASRTITTLSLYVIADGIQVALNGTIKGCGRQCITMPVVLFAYWIVGVPLAYYTAFVRHDGFMCQDSYFCGDVGLVTGMFIGTSVHMLLLVLLVFGSTNWKLEARKAMERVALDSPEAKHTNGRLPSST